MQPLDLLATVLPRVASIAVFVGVGVTLANLAVEFGRGPLHRGPRETAHAFREPP